ncbi:MAG TPA: cyanophycin synthetase, partial [bacterium]|nr:cyanophycin synthetase [bacterium]
VQAPFTVVVDYAHTPDALDNALRTARAVTQGRLAVLFGCGGDRDRGKRPQMGAIAARLADVTVLTSDNPRSEDPAQIVEDVARGMPQGKPVRILARPEAVRWILDQAQPGDFILLAGKGSEPYQELAGQKVPMDDRELARAWARARGLGVRNAPAN